jgi:death-on-curing protein
MINPQDAIRIQKILIDEFGGLKGVRDKELLESAISRPFQTFNKKDIYFTPIDKAAALIESILINRPFISGNERIGYVLMRLLLMDYGFDIKTTEDKKYSLILAIVNGSLKFDQIVEWLKDKTSMSL